MVRYGGGIHSLRKVFATHLLEGGTDLKMIQASMWHVSYKTRERYARVSARWLAVVVSPLDRRGGDAGVVRAESVGIGE